MALMMETSATAAIVLLNASDKDKISGFQADEFTIA